MILVYRSDYRGGGWERYWATNKNSVFYSSLWNCFNYLEATEVRRERVDIDTEGRIH